MKTLIALFLVLLLVSSCEKEELFPPEYYQQNVEITQNNPSHSKAQKLENLLSEMINKGIPGMMLTIHDEKEGYWSGASGLADLASKTPLKTNHITRVGSTVKTFTAVTILLLQEEGKLNIEDPVSDYLAKEEIKGLENADKCTVKQLLQHSSGIFNYIQNLNFQTASLNDLTKTWYPGELMNYARGQKAYFAPGTDVRYSNTNYILLGMIIEKVTGKPFYEVFNEKIFDPLKLQFTRFAATNPVPDGIIRGYVDFYSNKNLINATYYSGWDYFTADGGLISNAFDLNVFLTKLFNGYILSEKSLAEMLSWTEPKNPAEDEFDTSFGLGIFKIKTTHGPAYIHSGDAIGYFASMVYFPEQKVTVSWAVNGNYGQLNDLVQSQKAMEKIFETVFNNPEKNSSGKRNSFCDKIL